MWLQWEWMHKTNVTKISSEWKTLKNYHMCPEEGDKVVLEKHAQNLLSHCKSDLWFPWRLLVQEGKSKWSLFRVSLVVFALKRFPLNHSASFQRRLRVIEVVAGFSLFLFFKAVTSAMVGKSVMPSHMCDGIPRKRSGTARRRRTVDKHNAHAGRATSFLCV